MFTWIFWAAAAYIPTGLAAMNGDFEAFYWFMNTKRDLVPEVIQIQSEMYFNRMNGVIIGFQNTSYKQPLNNWTDYEEDPDNEYDADEDPFAVES